MSKLETQNHPHDRLFHGLRKNTRGSLRCLYNNPKITLSQLLVTAMKAESGSQEVKVREGIKVKNLTEAKRETQQEEIAEVQKQSES